MSETGKRKRSKTATLHVYTIGGTLSLSPLHPSLTRVALVSPPRLAVAWVIIVPAARLAGIHAPVAPVARLLALPVALGLLLALTPIRVGLAATGVAAHTETKLQNSAIN